jgi:hypothetical protein
MQCVWLDVFLGEVGHGTSSHLSLMMQDDSSLLACALCEGSR